MANMLIIGGTGMLQRASAFFIQQGHAVTIVARNRKRLDYFAQSYPDRNVTLVSQDYTDTDRFMAALNSHHPYDTVISWIHSTSLDTLSRLIAIVSAANPQTTFYHVKGSSSYNPERMMADHADAFRTQLDYREVILGFQIEDGASRWLTNDEISDGVIHAVTHDVKRHVVGVTEPWAKRP